MNQIYLRSVVYNYKVQSIGVSAKGVGGGGWGGGGCETPPIFGNHLQEVNSIY